MSETQTLLLGFIAGVTILIGLPLGKMRTPRPGLRQFLNALAIGILLFLIWDVLVHAFEPIDTALGRLHDGDAGIGPVLGYGALFFLGLSIGLLSLVYYESWLAARRQPRNFGPGTMAPGELTAARPGIAGWSAARRLSLLIAVGIGLHNFGEGLAIGGSAAAGEIGLATVLVIGFALHNGTEGFGIVAPLAAVDDRPSWGFLLLMGLIGGGPTLLGTAIGSAVHQRGHERDLPDPRGGLHPLRRHPVARGSAQGRRQETALLRRPGRAGGGVRHRHGRHRRRRMKAGTCHLTRTEATFTHSRRYLFWLAETAA